MKKIKFTKQGKSDLKKLNKFSVIWDTPEYFTPEAPEDLHPYSDLSSYDTLVYDMGMYIDGAYGVNKFKTIEEFAKKVNKSEGCSVKKIVDKINSALKLNIIKIK
jgi:hypothetical protein